MEDAAKAPMSSIFKRGGNKQETSADPQRLVTEQEELNTKLDELEEVWEAPKQG